MKRLLMLLLLCFGNAALAGPVVDNLQEEYRNAGAGPFNAERGAEMWRREVTVSGQTRSCTTCHGGDLVQTGEHVRTGKRIEPMAVSANSKRLTDRRDIEKWFRRNCKWAWGRACTPQEKGDFLAFIRVQ